jgi:hypothetical protein
MGLIPSVRNQQAVSSVESAGVSSCGSDRLDLSPGTPPHFLRIDCAACGRFIRWAAKPIDPAEAIAFTMPFGRHRGSPMGELPHSYLVWLARAEGISPRIAERAECLLAQGG